jgi:hypothetical protein
VDRIDQAGKTGLIGFVADMPLGVHSSFEVAENSRNGGPFARDRDSSRRPTPGHERNAVLGRRSGAQMSEPVGKSDPAVDLGEKLGDPQARQRPRDIIGAVCINSAQRTDREARFGNDGRGQFASRRRVPHFPQPGFELATRAERQSANRSGTASPNSPCCCSAANTGCGKRKS